MKKILLSIAAVITMAVSARADEGMWLLPLLKQMNIKAMKNLGCKLSAKDIYDINHASLKDAIVQFGGGCTGEIISNEGLLVTNHHCGYSNIQKLSSDEHNYLENGYWAMTRAEELPCPGLTVAFLQCMHDVSDKINAEKARIKQQGNKNPDALAEYEQKLIDDILVNYPNCQAEVTSFYNNNVYYLIVYKEFTDIRFVGAPPARVGKFGGETDNWMWPRHTGDFSMFRVYANKNNEPAAYSIDNVPYIPKKSLTISLKGIKENDFTFIMGYPGRTQRFQTASQLNQMMELNDIRVAARTARQNVMREGMESSPSIRLQYANKFASSANGWKKWQGQRIAFKQLNIIPREIEKESRFMDWVKQSPTREQLYGNSLTQISNNVDSALSVKKALTLINETLSTIGTNQMLMTFIGAYSSAMQQKADTAAAIKAALGATLPQYKDYNEDLERKMAYTMLSFYKNNADSAFYSLADFHKESMQGLANTLFDSSYFANKEKLAQFANMPTKEVVNILAKDPNYVLYKGIRNIAMELYSYLDYFDPSIENGSEAFAAGLLEWEKGKPTYPDANFTMRLTYGTVKPYSPKDGVLYNYYTTLKGVIEKDDPNNYEFDVPAKLKDLYNAQDFGEYVDKMDDQLHTCFLTNNDITGGNSGSPVLNAKGELIGLAFDGNWESMSSDVMFEPQLQRCICVDIRYVLFMMDKFGGAGHLLKEMKIVR